jgi:hypothetical protein
MILAIITSTNEEPPKDPALSADFYPSDFPPDDVYPADGSEYLL